MLLLLAAPLRAEEEPKQATPFFCPVELVKFEPSGVRVWVKNVSGKRIVGVVFNVALASPTEHWKWLHWNFDQNRSLRDFGWNKPIQIDEKKKLSWDFADLDFKHGGGGAFVLTSVLFEDGTSWEEAPDMATCKIIWYNDHKKSFFRPIDLPVRE